MLLGIAGILFGAYQLASSRGQVFPIIYGVVCLLSYSIIWFGSMKNSRRYVLFSLMFGSFAVLSGIIIGVYLAATRDKFSWPYFCSGILNIGFLVCVYNYYKELMGLEEGVQCNQLWMLFIHDG